MRVEQQQDRGEDEAAPSADERAEGADGEPEEREQGRVLEAEGHRRLLAVGMRRVGELAKLAGDEVGGLLADVDGVVADPLEAAGDDEDPQAPLALLAPRSSRTCSTVRRFARSISSSRSTSASARSRSRCWKERIATRVISSARTPISAKAGDDPPVRQACRSTSFVSFATVVQRSAIRSRCRLMCSMREHEPQVGRDGRLPRQQRLDALLEAEVARVDLVVEGDHLVGELEVLLDERARRRLDRADDEPALVLERLLELGELLVEGDSRARHRPRIVRR